MTEKKLLSSSFIGPISFFAFSSILKKISGLFITAICIRYLSKADFSILAIYLLSIQIAGKLVNFGQDNRLRVDLPSSKKSIEEELSLSLSINLMSFFIFFLPLAVITYICLSTESLIYLSTFVVSTFFFQKIQIIKGVYATKIKPKPFLFLTLTYLIADLLFFTFFIFYQDRDAFDTRIFSLLFSYFLSFALLATFYLRRIFKLKFIFRYNQFISGGKIFLYGLAMTAVFLIERTILNSQDNSALVAEIFVAMSLISPITLLLDAVNKRFAPLFFKLMHDNDEQRIQKIFLKLIITTSIMIFIFSYFIHPVGLIYAGEKYDTQSFKTLLGILIYYPLIKMFGQLFVRKLIFFEKGLVLAITAFFSAAVYIFLIFTYGSNITATEYSILHLGFYIFHIVLVWFANKVFLIRNK